MSLLIKALQKAEQSKGEAVEAASAAAPAPALPAVIPAELELAPHHEVPAPSLRDESGFDTPEVPPVSAAAQRQAASTVFRASQAGHASSGPSRAVWLAGGGLLLLLLLGGGFYYFLSSLEKPELVAARPMTPPPAPPVVIEAPVENTVAMPVEDSQPVREAAEPVAPSVPQTQEQPFVPPAKPADPIVKQEDVVRKPAVDGVPRVTRNRAPKAAVSDDVLAGYQAYMTGDDAAAARYYRQAAQADPRSVDAWLGVAAVAARQGKSEDATAHYLRVLELEPRNVAAQTGLIGLVGQSDPVASESRLKNLLAQQPEAPFLHAALGNHYAELGQWPMAQQAYFQAFRFDAKNAEYAFNLAVSLDQMGKSGLALTHYQRALDLSPVQGGGLDRAQLEARVAQLRQSLNE